MTLGDLVNLEPALNRLGDQKMPAKTRYAVARLIESVRKETKHFGEEQLKLVQELGTEQPDGRTWNVNPEHNKEYLTRIKELIDVSVVLDKWLLTPEVLDTLELSPNDVLALEPLMVKKE